MKIWRSPANKRSNWQPLLKEDDFFTAWSEVDSAVVFRSSDGFELNLKGRYDHQVEISMSDISMLLDTLSTDAIRQNPKLVEQGLAGAEDSLIRLLACVKGLKPYVPPEESTGWDSESQS